MSTVKRRPFSGMPGVLAQRGEEEKFRRRWFRFVDPGLVNVSLFVLSFNERGLVRGHISYRTLMANRSAPQYEQVGSDCMHRALHD